jgi:HNH endonuclease
VGSVEERFRRFVDVNGPVPAHRPELGPCHLWAGSTTQKGYGQFWLDGKLERAHRAAWILEEGEIPDGLGVLHYCDNPPCVRRSHLFLGTQVDNMKDRDAKGRDTSHVGTANGRAKLTEADVLAIRASDEPSRVIAPRFGLTHSNIRHIRNRKSWRHLG